MNIAVYGKVLSERNYTGIGVYTYNILKAISGIDSENRYTIYSNEPIVHKIDGGNFKEKVVNFPKFWSYLRLPLEFVDSKKYDLLFVPKEMLPPLKRPRNVIVCFDLMGLMFSDRIAFDGKVHFWLAVNYALKKADRVIAISESTRRDILEKCDVPHEKVVTVHLGYDSKVYKRCEDLEKIDMVKSKYNIRGPYVINTSSLLWYRKNIPMLIKAYKLCRAKGVTHSLVITGKKGEAYGEIKTLIGSLGLERHVILTDFVPEQDLPVLLSGADALVFPSLHEGFGLPIVEAMACGCPVITSNVSSMPEVAGSAGMLVHPKSVLDLSSAIYRLLSDESLKEKMRKKSLERARSFSWEKTARETLKVFMEAM